MFFVLPGWLTLGVLWLGAGVCLAIAVGCWFRYLREAEDQ